MSERSTICAAFGWLFALSCALVACSSEATAPEVGGDTHWLAACDEDRECSRGSCICGLCTESCIGDAQCEGGPAAHCYVTASPGVQAACASGSAPDSQTVAICLAECSEDRECGSGQSCVAGACVQRPETPAQLDAGALGSGLPTSGLPDSGLPTSGLPTSRASEFTDLTSSVTFDEPVPAPPEPVRDFMGAADLRAADLRAADVLLGTWTEPGCDPADSETWSYGPGGCVTIVIARSAPSGAIRGQLSLSNEVDFTPWSLNWQVFAPANDPDRGYPVDIGPEHYQQIGLSPGFGPYTLLDPFFDGSRLQFWLAPMEQWDGWCKLQTSYPVPDGDPPYQCVPDGAALGDPEVDYGKLVLCTSEWSAGSCELSCEAALTSCAGTVTLGCNCVTEDRQAPDWERPECSPANCLCDENGCSANWYENRSNVEATWDGEVLTVRDGWNIKRPGAAMATLVRELVRELTP